VPSFVVIGISLYPTHKQKGTISGSCCSDFQRLEFFTHLFYASFYIQRGAVLCSYQNKYLCDCKLQIKP
jgi:hypothetical protein